MKPNWRKRLTWVTAPPASDRLGKIIVGEQLFRVRAGCVLCTATSVATIWRRFDYYSNKRPVYFSKCRGCHHAAILLPDEAAFLLLDAGVSNPVDLVPEAFNSAQVHHHISVPQAEELVLNRGRAYGQRHPLTFEARRRLAEALGDAGDASGAAKDYQRLLVDQESVLRHDHPSVLANRYRAAIWTARDGHPSPALVALKNLLVDQEGVTGPDHPNTLAIRGTVAELLAETGDREEALARLYQLRTDQLRVLGSEDPSTEATRRAIAQLEGE